MNIWTHRTLKKCGIDSRKKLQEAIDECVPQREFKSGGKHRNRQNKKGSANEQKSVGEDKEEAKALD